MVTNLESFLVIWIKTRMSSLSTAFQHCTGSPSQCSKTSHENTWRQLKCTLLSDSQYDKATHFMILTTSSCRHGKTKNTIQRYTFSRVCRHKRMKKQSTDDLCHIFMDYIWGYMLYIHQNAKKVHSQEWILI